jgi:CheY-like chemotaxis protein
LSSTEGFLDGTTIAVADDDEAMRQMLGAVLRSLGCDVHEYADGRELMARVGADDGPTPDLIISDVRMSAVGGFDVLHWKNAVLPDVPMILITAFGDERTHRRGSELGAAFVIDKPFDLAELGRTVEAALSSGDA